MSTLPPTQDDDERRLRIKQSIDPILQKNQELEDYMLQSWEDFIKDIQENPTKNVEQRVNAFLMLQLKIARTENKRKEYINFIKDQLIKLDEGKKDKEDPLFQNLQQFLLKLRQHLIDYTIIRDKEKKIEREQNDNLLKTYESLEIQIRNSKDKPHIQKRVNIDSIKNFFRQRERKDEKETEILQKFLKEKSEEISKDQILKIRELISIEQAELQKQLDVWKTFSEDRKNSQERLRILEEYLEQKRKNCSDLKNELHKIEPQLENVNRTIAILTKQIEADSTTVKLAVKQISQISSREQSISENIETIGNHIKNLELEIKDERDSTIQKEIDKINSEYDEIIKKLEAMLGSDIGAIESEFTKEEQKIQLDADNEKKKKKEEIIKLQKDIEKLRKELDNLGPDIKRLEQEISKNRGQITNLNQLRSIKKGDALKKLDEEIREITEKNRKLIEKRNSKSEKNIKSKLELDETKMEIAITQLNAITKKFDDSHNLLLSERNKKVSALKQKSLGQVKSSQEERQKKVNELSENTQLPKYASVKELDLLQQKKTLTAELEKQNELQSDLKSKLQAIDSAEHKSKKEELDQKKKVLQGLQSELGDLKDSQTRLNEELKETEEVIIKSEMERDSLLNTVGEVSAVESEINAHKANLSRLEKDLRQLSDPDQISDDQLLTFYNHIMKAIKEGDGNTQYYEDLQRFVKTIIEGRVNDLLQEPSIKEEFWKTIQSYDKESVPKSENEFLDDDLIEAAMQNLDSDWKKISEEALVKMPVSDGFGVIRDKITQAMTFFSQYQQELLKVESLESVPLSKDDNAKIIEIAREMQNRLEYIRNKSNVSGTITTLQQTIEVAAEKIKKQETLEREQKGKEEEEKSRKEMELKRIEEETKRLEDEKRKEQEKFEREKEIEKEKETESIRLAQEVEKQKQKELDLEQERTRQAEAEQDLPKGTVPEESKEASEEEMRSKASEQDVEEEEIDTMILDSKSDYEFRSAFERIEFVLTQAPADFNKLLDSDLKKFFYTIIKEKIFFQHKGFSVDEAEQLAPEDVGNVVDVLIDKYVGPTKDRDLEDSYAKNKDEIIRMLDNAKTAFTSDYRLFCQTEQILSFDNPAIKSPKKQMALAKELLIKEYIAKGVSPLYLEKNMSDIYQEFNLLDEERRQKLDRLREIFVKANEDLSREYAESARSLLEESALSLERERERISQDTLRRQREIEGDESAEVVSADVLTNRMDENLQKAFKDFEDAISGIDPVNQLKIIDALKTTGINPAMLFEWTSNIRAGMQKQKENLSELGRMIDQLEFSREALVSQQRTLEKAQSQAESILQDAQEAKEKLEDIQQEMDREKARLAEGEGKLASEREKFNRTMEDLRALSGSAEADSKAKIAGLEGKITELQQTIHDAERAVEEAKKQAEIEKQKALDNLKPDAKGKSEGALAQKEKELEKAKAQAASAERKIEALEKTNSSAIAGLRKLEEARIAAEGDLEEVKAKAERESAEAKKALDAAQAEVIAFQGKLDVSEKAKETALAAQQRAEDERRRVEDALAQANQSAADAKQRATQAVEGTSDAERSAKAADQRAMDAAKQAEAANQRAVEAEEARRKAEEDAAKAKQGELDAKEKLSQLATEHPKALDSLAQEKAKAEAEAAASQKALKEAQVAQRNAEAETLQANEDKQAAERARKEALDSAAEAKKALDEAQAKIAALQGELDTTKRDMGAAISAQQKAEQESIAAKDALTQAEQRATRADKIAADAENRATQADQKAADAERRAKAAEQRAMDADKQAKVAEQRALEADEAKKKAEEDAANAKQGELSTKAKLDQLETESQKALESLAQEKAKAEATIAASQKALETAQAAQRTAELEAAKANEAKRAAEETMKKTETDLAKAAARATEAEGRAKKAEERATEAEERARKSEKDAADAELRAKAAEQRATDAAKQAEAANQRALESEEAKRKAEQSLSDAAKRATLAEQSAKEATTLASRAEERERAAQYAAKKAADEAAIAKLNLQDKQKENTTLQASNADLLATNAALHATNADLASQIGKLSDQIKSNKEALDAYARLQKEHEKLKAQYAALSRENSVLKDENDALKRELKALREKQTQAPAPTKPAPAPSSVPVSSSAPASSPAPSQVPAQAKAPAQAPGAKQAPPSEPPVSPLQQQPAQAFPRIKMSALPKEPDIVPTDKPDARPGPSGSSAVTSAFDYYRERARKVGRKDSKKQPTPELLTTEGFKDFGKKMSKSIKKKSQIRKSESEQELKQEFEHYKKERQDKGKTLKYDFEQWQKNREVKRVVFEDTKVVMNETSDAYEIQINAASSGGLSAPQRAVYIKQLPKEQQIVAEITLSIPASHDTIGDNQYKQAIISMLESSKEVARRTGNKVIELDQCEGCPDKAHLIEEYALLMGLEPRFDKRSQEALDVYRREKGLSPPSKTSEDVLSFVAKPPRPQA